MSERQWRISGRDWKPLTSERLEAVLYDLGEETPDNNVTPDEVYCLAREVRAARREGVRHALLAAIGYLGGVSAVSKEVVMRTLQEAARPLLRGEVDELTEGK